MNSGSDLRLAGKKAAKPILKNSSSLRQSIVIERVQGGGLIGNSEGTRHVRGRDPRRVFMDYCQVAVDDR